MDSANSGSIQSSSGGDEEFDSRPGSSDPLLSFFQSNTAGSAAPFYSSLPDFASHLLPYDQTATTAAAAATATNPRTFNPPPPSSFSLNTSQVHTNTTPSSSSAGTAATANNPTATPRGSRKRTRASRRAPTTVLTTDTSNFRAMVQEFTGIPSPPFAPSPLTRSTRFDHHLFSSASPSSSLPPYLLRPFAQKLNTSIMSGSTPSIETTIAGTSSIPVTSGLTGVAGVGALPTNEQAHAQTLVNMQNPLLSFQSLLQSQLQPKYDTRSMLNVGSRAPPSMGISGDYTGSTIPHGLLGSEKLHQNSWPGTGSGSGSGSVAEPNMPGPIQLNPVASTDYATNTQQQRVSTSCKLNYSTAGSSEFVNVSREQDTAVAATRGEGMVDSWLCSSSSDR
ncbi:VQ motif-containing protein [Rhynchospora pubera]|uniref:VQ motif-containing protein n=1 Tax=Rhynchospora pubera TaxID=906938 RepID=A0AAV8CVY4_9POAL|nr:VQ motif-containing protein [Rhynchospora pubera]